MIWVCAYHQLPVAQLPVAQPPTLMFLRLVCNYGNNSLCICSVIVNLYYIPLVHSLCTLAYISTVQCTWENIWVGFYVL